MMFLAKYEPVPDCPDIVPITRENYEPFGKLHSRHMDMYWNSERLLEDIDNWTIYLYWRDGVAAGAIYFTGDLPSPRYLASIFLVTMTLRCIGCW